MENVVVHRIVEQHAAARGEVVALDDDGARLTYRELNIRANGVARHLLDAGFRRGGHLVVEGGHGSDLATVLLAVLKAGGAYSWRAAADARPLQAAISRRPDDDPRAYRPIDVISMLQQVPRTSPNLPVLTRPTDLACILASEDGSDLFVPHSTLTALRRDASPARLLWDGEPTTFDLWAGLTSGGTLSVTAAALLKAA